MTEIHGIRSLEATATAAAITFPNPWGHWPTDPTIPDSGLNDPTLDLNWPDDMSWFGNSIDSSLYHNDPMQIVMEQLTYIDAHPTDTKALVIFGKTITRLSARGDLSDADMQFLDQSNPMNLIKDGIEQSAMYAFLFGYGGASSGDITSVNNYANALLNALQGIPNPNKYVTAMIAEAQTLTSSTFQTYIQQHIAGPNPIPAAQMVDVWGNTYVHKNRGSNTDRTIYMDDIIWTFTDPVTGKVSIYDWTAAQADLHSGNPQYAEEDNKTLETIKNLISNSDGAAGAPNPNIPYLDGVLVQMQAQDALNTFFSILKQTGDVGMAILAFIFALEGDKMNQLSGNADVMDKQHQLNDYAKQIEDLLRGFTSVTDDSAGQLRGLLQSLFTTIQSSNQFSGLQNAVKTAISTLKSATLTGATDSDLWTEIEDPSATNDDLAKALTAAIAPSPATPPAGNPTQFLQSLLGGIDGIVTGVTSASTQANTIASQLQSLIQALDKVMTGVIDPNNGMDAAVNKTSINHQTGN